MELVSSQIFSTKEPDVKLHPGGSISTKYVDLILRTHGPLLVSSQGTRLVPEEYRAHPTVGTPFSS